MRPSISSKAFSGITLLVLLAACLSVRGEDFVDDAAIKASFEKQLGEQFQAGGLPSGSVTVEQLHRAAKADLALPPAPEPASGESAFARARAATLILGHLYLCGKCERYHANLSGGILLSPDGLALTNYHVLDFREAVVFGAMSADGQVYPIDEVLAASKADDLALVRLRDAGNLPYVPIAGKLPASGDELFVISHPDGHFHTLTRGHLARKYLTAKERAPRLQITADFAKGSSGSGIFNLHGELIGLAVSTNSIYYTEHEERKDNLQMVVKSGVPVEALLRLLGTAGRSEEVKRERQKVKGLSHEERPRLDR